MSKDLNLGHLLEHIEHGITHILEKKNQIAYSAVDLLAQDIEIDENEIFEQIVDNENVSFYFQGYTSEDLSQEQQTDLYHPYFQMFQHQNTKNIVYPWESGHITYSLWDVSKALLNIRQGHDIIETNYGKSFKKCQNEVLEFYENYSKTQIGQINLTGYSLGTQFIYYFLSLLIKSDNPILYKDKVDNVVLLAGVLSAELLTKNLKAFMGKDGPIKGDLVIVSSSSDYVLQVFVHYLQANPETTDGKFNDPVGRANFCYVKARKSLEKQYEDENHPEIEDILKRIKTVQIEKKIIGPTIGHLAYMFPVNANRISKFVNEKLNPE